MKNTKLLRRILRENLMDNIRTRKTGCSTERLVTCNASWNERVNNCLFDIVKRELGEDVTALYVPNRFAIPDRLYFVVQV